MSIFTRAVEGQPLRVPAAAYNGAMEVAEWFQTRGRPTGGGPIGGVAPRHQILVRVKNSTGSAIAFGGCVPFEESAASLSAITGSGTFREINSSPILVASTRTTTTKIPQDFGIAVEPIPDGETGLACVGGICLCSAGVGSGWVMPIISGSGVSFSGTSKRTSAQVIGSTTDGYAIVYLSPAPWQTRRSVPGASQNVTNADRGNAIYNNTTTGDGFSDTQTISLSLGGGWSELIDDSVIKVPTNGIYDIEYNIYSELTFNGGVRGTVTGAYTINVGHYMILAKLTYVSESTGLVIGGLNYPGSGGDGACLINPTIIYESSPGALIGFPSKAYGNATIKLRTSLSSSVSRAVGIQMVAIADIGAYSISASLFTHGVGSIQPAMQEMYIEPP